MFLDASPLSRIGSVQILFQVAACLVILFMMSLEGQICIALMKSNLVFTLWVVLTWGVMQIFF